MKEGYTRGVTDDYDNRVGKVPGLIGPQGLSPSMTKPRYSSFFAAITVHFFSTTGTWPGGSRNSVEFSNSVFPNMRPRPLCFPSESITRPGMAFLIPPPSNFPVAIRLRTGTVYSHRVCQERALPAHPYRLRHRCLAEIH